MKKYIFCYCMFLSFCNLLYTQEFPDLDPANYCCSNPLTDAFLNGQCCLDPWGISHGTPWIAGTNLDVLQVCGGRGFGANENPGNEGATWGGSEGAIYEYVFLEGRKYTLSAHISGGPEPINEAWIRLANGINEITTPTAPNSRTYEVPSTTFSQDIFYEKDFSNEGTNYTFEFVPENNFTHLWIALADDDNHSNNQNAVCFNVSDISITCCKEEQIYHSTETPIAEGVSPQHRSLPVITHVKNKILATADDGDIIIKDDENITFKAGVIIDIEVSNGNSFSTETGGMFEAEIEDCNCNSLGNNLCLNYLPSSPSNQEGFQSISVPSAFNPASNVIANTKAIVLYGTTYIMPYNAHKAIFRVFKSTGELVHEQIVDDLCNGITAGLLQWDGCFNGQSLTNQVFAYTLYLENCFTSKLFEGDITLAASSSYACGNGRIGETDNITQQDVASSRNKRTTKNLHNFQYDYDGMQFSKILNVKNDIHKTNLFISPNISKNIALIDYTISKSDYIQINLQDMLGKRIKIIQEKNFIKKGEYQIPLNLSNLSKGTYIIELQSTESRIGKRVVKL